VLAIVIFTIYALHIGNFRKEAPVTENGLALNKFEED
jgi:hypothetical protein